MDAITAKRHRQLLQAYIQLGRAIDIYKILLAEDLSRITCQIAARKMDPEEIYHMSRDSVIKRFEFCFDLTWKFLKIILHTEHGLEIASPRPVVLESFRVELITERESDLFEDLLDSRNQTSHIYDEEAADRVATTIVSNFAVMQKMIQKLAP